MEQGYEPINEEFGLDDILRWCSVNNLPSKTNHHGEFQEKWFMDLRFVRFVLAPGFPGRVA